MDKRWVFQEPKTRRSRRQIALAAQAVAALQRHQERQEAEREHMGISWRPHDLVFCSQQGMPLIARNVYRSFKELVKRGALPNLRSRGFGNPHRPRREHLVHGVNTQFFLPYRSRCIAEYRHSSSYLGAATGVDWRARLTSVQ
jgi:hypothetical protein